MTAYIFNYFCGCMQCMSVDCNLPLTSAFSRYVCFFFKICMFISIINISFAKGGMIHSYTIFVHSDFCDVRMNMKKYAWALKVCVCKLHVKRRQHTPFISRCMCDIRYSIFLWTCAWARYTLLSESSANGACIISMYFLSNVLRFINENGDILLQPHCHLGNMSLCSNGAHYIAQINNENLALLHIELPKRSYRSEVLEISCLNCKIDSPSDVCCFQWWRTILEWGCDFVRGSLQYRICTEAFSYRSRTFVIDNLFLFCQGQIIYLLAKEAIFHRSFYFLA